MTYTVWSGGQQIGATEFELTHRGRKRCGVFRPTAHGLSVLPAITGLFPALFDFKALCSRRGIDAEASPEDAGAALEMLSDTPEGARVIAATRQVSMLELRDGTGRVLAWDSIAISDLEELRLIAGKLDPDIEASPAVPVRDPVRYMISATLSSGVHDATPRRTQARMPLGSLPA